MKIDGRLFIVFIMALALIPGAYAISTSTGGGSSVSTNGPSSAQGNFVANSDGATGYGVGAGDPSLAITNWVEDATGKRAEVKINVQNAATLHYSYSLTPNKDYIIVPKRSFVYAQESITATGASSIDAYSLATNGPGQNAKAEITVNGGATNDANLKTYTNTATATATQVIATQRVGSASGDAITLDTSGAYGSKTSSILTKINRVPTTGIGALFKGSSESISSQSIWGPSTSTNLKGHIEGAIDSTATATAAAGTVTQERDSDGDAIKADLNDKAWTQGGQGYVSGMATFFVDQAWGGKIRGAVGAACGGNTINVAAGTYNENVVLDNSVSVNGAGSDKTTVNGDGSAVTINPSTIVTLSGIQITGGNALKAVEFTTVAR